MKPSTILALLSSALSTPFTNAPFGYSTPFPSPVVAPSSRRKGKGESLPGNKHAKSSFKQNKRRGL